ncbi:hypothetical protein PR003_g3586 [Phytophthora rubi]|uniref:RxLR effector protein n=1 Tax=Phytophthora rubi TaxID=129364 RepID=A0A6A3NN34_9STRA|nr:hypothetical protein PR002_g3572 [Phytophthora rubi]KAE9047547.1 hypothetical protein PR001_g4165 [Phytophthora rubi]KAE9353984.1 hypothetical protein PR003_g3586 [Phytophthora rubi]
MIFAMAVLQSSLLSTNARVNASLGCDMTKTAGRAVMTTPRPSVTTITVEC